MNLFEYAIRNKLRFASSRGELNVEQLFDVPLRSRDSFNLNEIAKTVNKTVKDMSEENFVEASRNTPSQVRAEKGLELVKYVIETKLAAEEEAATRAERKAEKEKLLKILAEKQDGKLSSLSEKEIQRRIASLEA
jgi:hypothetical protein